MSELIANPLATLDALGRLGHAQLWYRSDMEACVAEAAEDFPCPQRAISALCAEYRFALSAVLGCAPHRVRVTSQVGVFHSLRPETHHLAPGRLDYYSVFIESTGPRVQLNVRGYEDVSTRLITSVSLYPEGSLQFRRDETGPLDAQESRLVATLEAALAQRSVVAHVTRRSLTWTVVVS